MNIHIVGPNDGRSQVLSRFARYLADGTGWSLAPDADPSADVNLYLPYLYYKGLVGRSAAWFTHYDSTLTGKESMWDSAAHAVDLRITCANMYADMLRPHGPTVKVPPPIELERFTIGPRVQHDKPVVGVSGYVYPGGRKGERLVEQLSESKLGRNISLTASGKGWPAYTKEYTWAEMPNFYRGLDVYLCTATIEGIPVPPLEALACGVKIVIPQQVGMLDDLPEMEGIYRYERGDYESMCKAIERAVAGKPEPEALRECVRGFTIDAWCDGFKAAMSRFYGDDTGGEPEGEQCGVYVVAFGEPARECAKVCIGAVKALMPELPVVLVGDKALGAGCDSFIEQPDLDIGGRTAKLRVDELAPQDWHYVLYLDADTEPVQPFKFLFDLLKDGWEFVICKDMQRFALAATMVRPDNLAECNATWAEIGSDQVLQYNGGVFAFRRNARTRAFFLRWQAEWQRWGKRDQGALLRALHTNPLRVCVLTNVWNASDRYPVERQPVIVHHNIKARRWEGIINGRLDSAEAWKAVETWEGAR